MSLAGVFVRFLIYFPLGALVIGLIIDYFQMPKAAFSGILYQFVITLYVVESYGLKKNRYFDRSEKRLVLIGITLISLIYQWLFVLATDTVDKFSSKAAFIVFSIVALLSLGITAAGIDTAGKRLVKKGIIDEYPEGQSKKAKNKIQNSFLRSLVRLLVLTVGLIIVVLISIPIVGELMK